MYVGPSVRNVSKAKWRLKTGRGNLSMYVMVLNHDSRRLEYFHNGILKQKALHKRDMDIVGLAGSADECIELVEKITSNAFEATGSYDIYQYMMQEQA